MSLQESLGFQMFKPCTSVSHFMMPVDLDIQIFPATMTDAPVLSTIMTIY